MATKNTMIKEKPQSEVKIKAKSKKIYEPHEQEIRDLAETLYANRLENGEPGTAENDWLRAKAYLRRTV